MKKETFSNILDDYIIDFKKYKVGEIEALMVFISRDKNGWNLIVKDSPIEVLFGDIKMKNVYDTITEFGSYKNIPIRLDWATKSMKFKEKLNLEESSIILNNNGSVDTN